MRLKNEDQILKIIRFLPPAFILIGAIITATILYFENQALYQEEKQQIQKQYIEENKKRIKARIDTLYEYILTEQSSSEELLKKDLKQFVNNAHAIMTNIYNTYKNTKSKKEIWEIIKTTLRSTKHFEGRGYFYIVSMQGTIRFHGLNSKLEGKNVYNIQDSQGKFVSQNVINALKKSDEFFDSWYWPKSNNDTKEYKKIGFHKRFDPYDVYIGLGEYTNEATKKIQEHVLNYISQIRYENTGYIFVNTYDGINLAHIREEYIGKNIYTINDVQNNRDTINKVIHLAIKGGGFYSIIQNKKPNNGKTVKKTIYVKGLNNWEWAIGTGFYEDDVNQVLIQRRHDVDHKFEEYLTNIIILSLILTATLLFISIIMSKVLESKFNTYRVSLQKLLDKNIRQNKNLKTAQKAAKIGSWELDITTYKASWSKEVLDIFGLEEPVSHAGPDLLRKIIVKEDWQCFENSMENAIENGTKHSCIYRIKRPDGEIRWIDCKGQKVKSTNKVVGLIQDITHIKSFEIKLAETNERLKAIFDASPLGAVIVNKEKKIIEVNASVQEMLGFSKEELIGREIKDLSYNDGEYSKNTHLFHKIITGEIDSYHFEKRYIKKDGSYIWGNLTVAPIFDNEGEIAYILGLIENITGRKKIQQKLDEQNERLRVIIESSPLGIIIVSPQREIIQTNKTLTTMFGYSAEEFLTKSMRDLTYEEEAYMKSQSSIKQLIQKEIKSFQMEKQYIRKDGSIFWGAVTAAPIFDDQGNIQFLLGMLQDIDNIKKAQDKIKENEDMLHQQSKMAAMGEMLENIAHQWRQPLSVISTAASSIQLQKELNTLEDDYLDSTLRSITNSTQHLSKTIDDFRDFFKPNREIQHFSLEDTCNKTLELVSSKFKNRNILVIKEIDDYKVFGFQNELIQVMINILNNARDILEQCNNEQKLIFIQIYKEDDTVIIKIKDNAGGIPQNIVEKVFEPYFTTKHKSQGTGIGLYMSEEIIVKHMNGSITAFNESFEYEKSQYIGAVFKITLPLT